MIKTNENNVLIHHGILGMKWGVRRYQNKDGTLTEEGKKRYLDSDGTLNKKGKKEISKEYIKLVEKSNKNFDKQYSKMYFDAYNKTASDMNDGGIDKFNANQRKKFGDNYAERDEYLHDYEQVFNKRFENYLNKKISDFYKSDESFNTAERMVKNFDMVSWNDLAKKNAEFSKELKKFR